MNPENTAPRGAAILMVLLMTVPPALAQNGDNLSPQSKFDRHDPNRTRLFFGPTAHSLKAGQFYFADYYLVWPTLAVGVTDHLELIGGISLFPEAESQFGHLGLKLSTPVSSYAHLAIGGVWVIVSENYGIDAGLSYAVGTFGSVERSITVAAALPVTTEYVSSPAFLVGGEWQISNRLKLIAENWILTENGISILFSPGVRFFGEKLAVGFAMVGSNEFFSGPGFPFRPWVDFTVLFGK